MGSAREVRGKRSEGKCGLQIAEAEALARRERAEILSERSKSKDPTLQIVEVRLQK